MKTDFNYELYFELTPDLLCIAGFDGYFKKVNPAVSRLLGYTMEELYSRPINDFVFEDDKSITAGVRKELTRSKPLYNFENRYVTKSGEIVWLSWTSFPIESDKVIFAIAKNITHKKQQDAERNLLLADLTSANKDLKQLTYTTSHDLRSPVNNLLSILGLLDISRIKDPQSVELLEFLKSAGEKLKETLNNYVDVLIEKHVSHLNIEVVRLDEILNDVIKSVSSFIQTSKAEIRSDFIAFNEVKFNRNAMASVFLNLITNSIKYSKPDSLPVISIYTENSNGLNQLIIKDNGQGFDMEKVSGKIFGLNENFHNTSDSKGIGLYLVYNHVTNSGGQIKVESRINEGTKFIITFKQ
jgi:PAS domain S-box-containing protein